MQKKKTPGRCRCQLPYTYDAWPLCPRVAMLLLSPASLSSLGLPMQWRRVPQHDTGFLEPRMSCVVMECVYRRASDTQSMLNSHNNEKRTNPTCARATMRPPLLASIGGGNACLPKVLVNLGRMLCCRRLGSVVGCRGGRVVQVWSSSYTASSTA